VPDVAVIGASGYTGALAAALVQRHPYFVLTSVTSRSDAGLRLDELYPHHRVPLTLDALDETMIEADAAIVALPHGASAPVVAQLHERGMRVVDLSADFRLRDVAVYERHYVPHAAPQLLPQEDHRLQGLPDHLGFETSAGARLSARHAFLERGALRQAQGPRQPPRHPPQKGRTPRGGSRWQRSREPHGRRGSRPEVREHPMCRTGAILGNAHAGAREAHGALVPTAHRR